jgi:ketosteroid isomerase-like protein
VACVASQERRSFEEPGHHDCEEDVVNEDVERYLGGAQAMMERDWEAYGDLYAEDLVMRTPGLPGVTRGREARVAMARGLATAFPDGRAEVERAFGEGDWACVQARFTGTHTGPLPTPDGEIPATNKSVDFTYCMVVKFENGNAAELDEYFDQLLLLTQLGIVS